MILKCVTWNINSIRARLDNLSIMIKKYNPDLIMLQETKVQDHQFPLEYINDLGYDVIFIGQKSYNGVSILSKNKIELISKKNDIDDQEARYIEGNINFNGHLVKFINVYVPNGDSLENLPLEKTKKFQYKLNYYKSLYQKISTYHFNEDFIIIGGDFNVALTDKDLSNPKQNFESVGFHSLEKLSFNQIISDFKFVDLYRYKYPDSIGYTWFDYRTKAFERNVGWRIDYILGSLAISKKFINIEILTDIRSLEKPSDHVPLLASFDI